MPDLTRHGLTAALAITAAALTLCLGFTPGGEHHTPTPTSQETTTHG